MIRKKYSLFVKAAVIAIRFRTDKGNYWCNIGTTVHHICVTYLLSKVKQWKLDKIWLFFCIDYIWQISCNSRIFISWKSIHSKLNPFNPSQRYPHKSWPIPKQTSINESFVSKILLLLVIIWQGKCFLSFKKIN